MNINGHGLRDHLRLVAPLLGFIAAVWVLRLITAAAGAPHGVVIAISVTVGSAFCVLLAVLLIHIRRFGGYANVVFVTLLISAWESLLISAAVAFSALTGIQTIYTAPEFTVGTIPPLQRILGRMTFGLAFGTILGSAMGCLLLWMLRRLPTDPGKSEHGLERR